MLFINLLVYIILWIPAKLFLFPVSPIVKNIPVLQPPFLFLIILILLYLVVFLSSAYQPEFKRILANTIRIMGIRWMALVTAISALVFAFLRGDLHSIVYGIFLPTAAVSFLNFIGFELKSKHLHEEKSIPERVIRPGVEPGLEPPVIEDEILKSYQWEHENQKYALDLLIRRTIFDDFKNRERILDYRRWAQENVAEGIIGEIRELADKLVKMKKAFQSYEEVSFVLSFVQQALTYQKEEGEYPRYPVEALVDEIGDCEDFSILGAAVLKSMGYEVALLILPTHAALGVGGTEGMPGSFFEKDGIQYYYCEMTAEGWKIGDMPEDYQGEGVEIFPIPDRIVKAN